MKSLFRRKTSFGAGGGNASPNSNGSSGSGTASPARAGSSSQRQSQPPPQRLKQTQAQASPQKQQAGAAPSAMPASYSASSLEAPKLQLRLSNTSTDGFDFGAFGQSTSAAPSPKAKASTLPSRRSVLASIESPAKGSHAGMPSAWRTESPRRQPLARTPASFNSDAPPSDGHSFATAAESPSGSPSASRSPLPTPDGLSAAAAAAAVTSPLASRPALSPESSTSSLVHVGSATPVSGSESHEAITPASAHHARFTFARQQSSGAASASKEQLPLMTASPSPVLSPPRPSSRMSASRYPGTPEPTGGNSPRTNYSRPTMSPQLGPRLVAASPIVSSASQSSFVSAESQPSPSRPQQGPPSLQLRTAPANGTPRKEQNGSAHSTPTRAPASPPRLPPSATAQVTPTAARRGSGPATPTSKSPATQSPEPSDAQTQREQAREAKQRAAAEAEAIAEERRLAKEQRAQEQAQRDADERRLQEQADREAAAVQERGKLAAEQAREMRRLQQAESLRQAEQAKVREAQELEMKRQRMWAAQREEEARMRDQHAIAAERAAAAQMAHRPFAHPSRSYSAMTTHDASDRLVVPRRKASENAAAAASREPAGLASPPRAAAMASPPQLASPLPASLPQAAHVESPLTASPVQEQASRQEAEAAPAQAAPWRFSAALAEGARSVLGALPASLTRQSLSAEPRQPDKSEIVHGDGWMCHGVVDPRLIKTHRRFEKVVVLRPRSEIEANASSKAKRKQAMQRARAAAGATPPLSAAGSDAAASEASPELDAQEEADEELVEVVEQRMYSDLGELIWTRTTPDVIARLVSHLDCADVKALRQTSSAIRQALGQLAGREVTLRRFLAPFGYRTWEPHRGGASTPREDPMPISLADCEAFLISHDLLPEYASVGRQYAANPRSMDPQIPRLARATTRAYNRVLARLRMQPYFRVPEPPRSANSALASPTQPSAGSPTQQRQLATRQSPGDAGAPVLPSPWRPGRAALFRVWVPCADPSGWMSDEELSRCERQMYECGVWTTALRRGDVVWNTAIGDQANQGRQIFDGTYLRDLAFLHDPVGHLPSHINSLHFSPSYFHNIIHSSSGQPVIYIDILPFRNELLASLRLVQDHIESVSPQGRYRVAKWLYRAVVNVTGGQIISQEGLQVVDEGWHGKLVIETEGTSEHAKALIARCAGPTASPGARAALLASVMGDAGRQSTFGPPSTRDANGAIVEATTPWAIIRERSRPGQIWMRPV